MEKKHLYGLIQRWQEAAERWGAHGDYVDDEYKNEFYAKAETFKTCIKDLKEVMNQ